MTHELYGSVVCFEGKKWYVDNTDENFKEDFEEISLFLIPEKYAQDPDLLNETDTDLIGFWVLGSQVEEIS